MSKRIVVNIMEYGDFDMPFVAISMLAPEGATKAVVKTLVEEAEEIFHKSEDTADAKTYLFTWGFTNLTSIDLKVGGGR